MEIGIAGGTCSGKTTLGRELARRFDAKLISIDDYFKDPKTFPLILDHPDYDRVEAIDWQNLTSDIEKMRAKNHLIIEGFLLFALPEIRSLMDFKIFIDLDIDELIRRRWRDNPTDSEAYIKTVVRDRHNVLVKPTMKYADLVLNGEYTTEQMVSSVLSNDSIKRLMLK